MNELLLPSSPDFLLYENLSFAQISLPHLSNYFPWFQRKEKEFPCVKLSFEAMANSSK